MSGTRVFYFVTDTLTEDNCACNEIETIIAPKGATGVEVSGNTDFWNFTPRLKDALWDDNGTFVDMYSTLSERGTTHQQMLDSLVAAQDNLYFGADTPFRGFWVAVCASHPNGTSCSTLTVQAWTTACCGSWTCVCATDGTDSSCASFAVSGPVTFTPPTTWLPNSVNGGPPRYHVQLTFAANLDSDTIIDWVNPLGVQTTGAAPLPLVVTTVTACNGTGVGTRDPQRFWFEPEYVGGIETTGDSCEALTVNWIVTNKGTHLTAGI